MADVSKSEILKKYPIGIGLDIFREALLMEVTQG
jgi:hypothetical protein